MIAFFFAPLLANANAQIQLYSWNTGEGIAPLVIAVKASESPVEAAQRYMKNLNKNPDLMELFQGQELNLKLTGFQKLDDSNREKRALLIANLPKDYTKNSLRVQNFQSIFKAAKHESYILPISPELGLNLEETRAFRDEISKKFPFLVALGGDDVSTELYKDPNFHSKNTNQTRDRSEIALIQDYVAKERGFMLGVCRGSQLTAVALGYKLIQDIPFQVLDSKAHANDWHPIVLKNTSNKILKTVLSGEERIVVNSLHHQAVKYTENGFLELAAIGEDRITEATEFKNGKGLLLQFHPELMDNKLGQKIIWNALKYKNSVIPKTCSKVF